MNSNPIKFAAASGLVFAILVMLVVPAFVVATIMGLAVPGATRGGAGSAAMNWLLALSTSSAVTIALMLVRWRHDKWLAWTSILVWINNIAVLALMVVAFNSLSSVPSNPVADRFGSGAEQAFMQACAEGDIATIRSYLAMGGNPNVTGERGTNALYVSWRHGQRQTFDYLLKCGADPNLVPSDGYVVTVLLKRIQAERSCIEDLPYLRSLLDAGLDPNLNVRGDSVLIHAARGPCVEFSALLMDYGADPLKASAQGKTAIEVAVDGTNWEVAVYLSQFYSSEAFQRVRQSISSNSVNELSEVSRAGRLSFVKAMRERGIELESK
ncbi:MAG: hypothetical protein WD768_06610 [Phycisphaeraceae bacterium]